MTTRAFPAQRNALAVAKRLRAILVITALLRAVAWGVAVGCAVLLASAAADMFTPLSVTTRTQLRGLAVAVGLATAIALVIRDRAVWSLERTALWLEERTPTMHFAFVTGLELEQSGATANGLPVPGAWTGTAIRRGAVAVVRPGSGILVLLAALLLLPGGMAARAAAPRAGDSLERSVALTPEARRNRLSPLLITITPPQYARRRVDTLDDPARVTALVGSTIEVAGRGAPEGIQITASADSPGVHARGPRWWARVRMPQHPAALILRDGNIERLIALEPLTDAPPAIVLANPAHDTVMRVATGGIPLLAQATDDIGLASAWFEIIVSSGGDETFTFRSTVLGHTTTTARTVALHVSLSLDSLQLKPGDILHVRAVANDRNDVTGPGSGASETRVIRVARADEGDSVAVDGAPPPEAQSVVSQRMLIMLAEALQRKRDSLSRRTVLQESGNISLDQKQLRRSVGNIIFARVGGEPTGEEVHDEPRTTPLTPADLLKQAEAATGRNAHEALDFEGGESPVVAINRPLLEAYNAMWDAGTELDQGEPGRALPHMRIALAAIQRARQAERVYLRGRSAPVVVDVPAARLQRREAVSPRDRQRRSEVHPELGDRVARLNTALMLSREQPAAATDSLMLLRVDLLEGSPGVAAELAGAIDALRRGDQLAATAAGIRARRLLLGPPLVTDSLGLWSTVP